jgi:hypothetical protein
VSCWSSDAFARASSSSRLVVVVIIIVINIVIVVVVVVRSPRLARRGLRVARGERSPVALARVVVARRIGEIPSLHHRPGAFAVPARVRHRRGRARPEREEGHRDQQRRARHHVGRDQAHRPPQTHGVRGRGHLDRADLADSLHRPHRGCRPS